MTVSGCPGNAGGFLGMRIAADLGTESDCVDKDIRIMGPHGTEAKAKSVINAVARKACYQARSVGVIVPRACVVF